MTDVPPDRGSFAKKDTAAAASTASGSGPTASASTASGLTTPLTRTTGMGFFRRMNIVILLVFVAVLAAIFLPTAWDTRTLSFHEEADGTFHATISRYGRTYDIQRTETTGSGEYIEMKISELVTAVSSTASGAAGAAERIEIATYSTCGHYRDEGTQFLFFEPHDFHCGWLSARLNDLFTPRISRVEFSDAGAVPTFLPSDQ